MYIAYALVFLVIGGFEAVLMRIQLARPNNHFVSPQVFNRLFTMHGTTMVFFVGMPILFGFGNYLVPLMIGARDMAFPRLNAFSFWISAFGGTLLLYFSYLGRRRPVWRGQRSGRGMVGLRSADGARVLARDTARTTGRCRLPERHRQRRHGAEHRDYDHQHALPGMTLNKMPLLVWLYLVMSAAHLFVAVGPLTRRADHADAGPLPRLALLRCAGRRLGGVVDALLLDLRPPRGLRAGHAGLRVRQRDHPGLLAQGYLRLPGDGRGFDRHLLRQPQRLGAPHVHGWSGSGRQHAFFVLSTMAIGVPTGIKIFNWLATIWGGKVHFTVAMLFAVAFLFQFLLAGLTGHHAVSRRRSTGSLAALTSSIAHFHFVLVGAIVFDALCRPSTTGTPKMTGRMLSEKLGKWHFWLFLIGFHLTFDSDAHPGHAGHAAPYLHV